MKNGRNPTRAQKLMMQKIRLNPENWLVVKNLVDKLILTHRLTGYLKTIPKIRELKTWQRQSIATARNIRT